MKLSLGDVFLSDLLPDKKTVFDRLVIDPFISHKIFSKDSFDNIFSSLKRNGVDGIELIISSNASMVDVNRVEKILKQFNFTIPSIHQPLDKLFKISLKEIERLAEIAELLKARVLVLHINVIGDQIFDRDYIKGLKNLEDKYRIKIGIENMPINPLWFFKTYTWKEDEFSNLARKAGFNITFDTTHLAQTGGDIVSFYKKSKEGIVNIQLSDYKRSFLNNPLMLTKGTHLPLGKGMLPIRSFLKSLKETNYAGIVTMEIKGTLTEILESSRIIKSIL